MQPYNNTSDIFLTRDYCKHRRISRTPSLATQILEKNFWNDIKINQKWSLEKDVFHVHALFL